MAIQHNHAPDRDDWGAANRSAATVDGRTVPLLRSTVEDRDPRPVEVLPLSLGVHAEHTAQCERAWVDPTVWERRDMRMALAARDLQAVFRLLHRFGVSQRRIAARTEQSQSEVSEILTGRRRVVSYGLLVRVADGLGVPRGWMGLAYDRATVQLLSSEVER